MRLSFTAKNAPPLPPPLPDVVLASQSVGRKHLLEKLGIRFRQAVARIDEDAIVDSKPETMLRRRAAAKASEVADHPRVYGLAEDRQTLVVAADSMALVGKRTFGKSHDREDTKTMLKSLMGKTHVFATAVHILLLEETRVKKTWGKLVKTRVTMRRMTPVEVESYVSRFDFTRFAAGYSLNDAPWDLITKIEGSYTNVIGFPFEVLLPILRKLKIIV